MRLRRVPRFQPACPRRAGPGRRPGRVSAVTLAPRGPSWTGPTSRSPPTTGGAAHGRPPPTTCPGSTSPPQPLLRSPPTRCTAATGEHAAAVGAGPSTSGRAYPVLVRPLGPSRLALSYEERGGSDRLRPSVLPGQDRAPTGRRSAADRARSGGTSARGDAPARSRRHVGGAPGVVGGHRPLAGLRGALSRRPSRSPAPVVGRGGVPAGCRACPWVGSGRRPGRFLRTVVVRRHRRGRGTGLRSRARRSWTPSRRVRAGPGPGGGKSGWRGGGAARPGRLLKDHGSSGKNPGQKPFSAR